MITSYPQPTHAFHGYISHSIPLVLFWRANFFWPSRQRHSDSCRLKFHKSCTVQKVQTRGRASKRTNVKMWIGKQILKFQLVLQMLRTEGPLHEVQALNCFIFIASGLRSDLRYRDRWRTLRNWKLSTKNKIAMNKKCFETTAVV